MAGGPGPRLRVMTYNVHGLRDDRAALVRVVRAAAPDVLMLQEAAGRIRWRTRCAMLANSFGMVVAAGGMPSVGNVILTTLRVRVYGAEAVRFPLTPGRHLRGAAIARCAVGRVPFLAVGSHLSTDPAERPVQAIRLREALAGRPDAVIFGADVNDTPGSPTWRALADGWCDPAGTAPEPTFPATGAHRRIDAVFAGPGCTVIETHVPDGVDARAASDHLPVVVDLSLPPAG